MIALGSCAETENWLKFAFDCKYILEKDFNEKIEQIDVIGKMLTKLHQNWKKF